MDETSFEPMNLAHLNFASDSFSPKPLHSETAESVSMPVTPDEVPPPLNLKNIPSEILKSSTVEALINQNEDLMARIKVGLRRLSLVENECSQQTEENRKLKAKNSALTDQMLVLREKDDLWKQKIQSIENETLKIKERSSLLEMDYVFIKSENQELHRKNQRLTKYRKKIRQSVRPFLRTLKRELSLQWQKSRELDSRNLQKESLIKNLRDQILEISKNVRLQTKSFEVNQASLLEQLETEKSEVSSLQLELKNLQQSLERERSLSELVQGQNSDFQNRIVSLERQLEESQTTQTQEIQNLKRQNQSLQSDLQYLREDLKNALESKEQYSLQLDREKSENNVLNTQLEHTRQMWEQKSQDNEKLRLKATSLERINAELSLQLKDQRKKAEEALSKTFEIKKNIDASENERALENKDLTQHIHQQNKIKLERIERLMTEIQTSAHESKTP